MMNAALERDGWIEEETALSKHWDEMVIKDPAVPFAGIWMEEVYICLYRDSLNRPISLLGK